MKIDSFNIFATGLNKEQESANLFTSRKNPSPSSKKAAWRKFQAESRCVPLPPYDLTAKRLVELLLEAIFTHNLERLQELSEQTLVYLQEGEMTSSKAVLKAIVHLAKAHIYLEKNDVLATVREVCAALDLEQAYFPDEAHFSENLASVSPSLKPIFYLVNQEKEKAIPELQQAAQKGDAVSRSLLQKMGLSWPLPTEEMLENIPLVYNPFFQENEYREAEKAYLLGNYEEALRLSEQTLEKENSVDGSRWFFATHQLRGDCQLLLGHYPEAIREYDLGFALPSLQIKAQLIKFLSKEPIEIPSDLEQDPFQISQLLNQLFTSLTI